MAQDKKIRLPSSSGGLVNYADEYKSRFQLAPGHVVLLVGVVLIIQLLLHLRG